MAKAAPIVISHWYHLIENLQASPMEFYTSVEKAIEKRQLQEVKLLRIDWREGGVMSAKREYLRVRRKEFVFDICGAPFGNGFFVSWWLGELPSGFLALLSSIPIIGLLFKAFIRPDTYYKIDTALMFQSSVRTAVMEVIDEQLQSHGLRSLTDAERKPIQREFFRR